MTVLLAIVLVLALVVGVCQRRGTFMVQYLFFLRYSLLLAAALMAGPVLAVTVGRDMIGNLFALDARGIAIVMGLGLFASSTVVYTFNLIFSLTHARTRLPFFRPERGQGHAHLDRQRALAAQLARFHFVVAAVGVVALGIVLLPAVREGALW